MRHPAGVSGEAFTLDSFLFQRRRFLSKDSGFHWSWDLFCQEEILSGLEFRLKKEPDGTSSLRCRYTATGDDGDQARFDYRVDLDRTSCRQGGRWWFRCPFLGDGGAPCAKRCRFLYLQRGQERFACRRCSALAYTSSTRNHNAVFSGYIQPTEALRRAAVGLLRSRLPERRRYLHRKAEAARQKIAEFSKRWRKIASRVVTGKARVRDRRYFEELADLLLGQEVRNFVEAAFGEPQGAEERPSSVAGPTLCFEMLEGFLDVATWKESPPMLKAARDPEGMTRLVLVSVMNHRLKSDGGHVHGSLAGQNYLEGLAQDPEALLRHVKLLDREARRRLKQLSSAVS